MTTGEMAGATAVSQLLRDDLSVLCLHRSEADAIYRDIFERRCYVRHGVTLRSGDTVVDVGANIGLFSIFAMADCHCGRVIAIEPAAPLLPLLRQNVSRWADRVEVVGCALAAAPGRGELTFYPQNSAMSGLHADVAEDRAVLQQLLANEIASDPALAELLGYVDRLAARRCKTVTLPCDVRTLSEILDGRELDRIDLLKIDAQKAELDVLRGIAPRHWPLIRQLSMEVHAIEDRVQVITSLLSERGFRVFIEHGELFAGTCLTNLFAVLA